MKLKTKKMIDKFEITEMLLINNYVNCWVMHIDLVNSNNTTTSPIWNLEVKN